ncbi:MAG: ABC transporter substrate-binding protein, partial [Firmicutes bacterium]|nr:ABC transporter substrate-binding protein [Bacillota bacterium]
LSIYSFAMVSPSAVKKYKDDFTSHPCGTGPFKFIEWRGGDRIVLESNKDYWGRTAYLDRIIFETVSDADARARNLERNRIDVMTGLRNDDIDDFKKNDDLKILEKSGFAVVFLALNRKDDYLGSAKVRISLAYAINKKRLLKSEFKERALIARGFLPPGVTGFAPEIKSQEFSPSKARKYMDKTIFYDGFDLELIYPDDSSLCFPEPEYIANSLKDDVEYLKINLKPKALDNESFWKKILAGDFSAALLGFSSPDSGGETMLALINNIFYEEKKFELLLVKARNTEVEEEKKKLYKDMQKDMVKDLQIIPLFYPRYYIAYGKKIKGIRILPNGICVFKDAWIEK